MESEGKPLPLHDATLVSIDLDWAQATARLVFTTADGRPRYIARGLRTFSLTHEEPWGPSVSVNAARLELRTDLPGQRLTIEMQSGDTITLEADQVLRREVRAV